MFRAPVARRFAVNVPVTDPHEYRIHIEDVLLFLALFTIPLEYMVSIGRGEMIYEEGITFDRVLWYLLLAVCIWKSLWLKDSRLIRLTFSRSVPLLTLAFILCMAVSALVVRYPSSTISTTIMTYIIHFLRYLLVVYVCRDRRILRLCIIGFVTNIVFHVGGSFYEIVSGKPALGEIVKQSGPWSNLLTVKGQFRIQGLTSNPNYLATDLILQLGLLLYLLFTVRLPKWRIALAALLLLTIVLIFATATRAASIIAVFGFMIFIIVAPVRRKRFLFAFMASFTFLCLIILSLLKPELLFLDRFLNKEGGGVSANEISKGARANMLRISLKMGIEHPFWGVGINQYGSQQRYFRKLDSSWLPAGDIRPHNVYIGTFAEMGVPGLTVLFLLHLAVAVQIIACFRSAPDQEARLLAAGLLVSFLGYMMCCNFYPTTFRKYGWLVMAFAGALAEVLRKEHRLQQIDTAGEPMRAGVHVAKRA